MNKIVTRIRISGSFKHTKVKGPFCAQG